MDQTHKFDSDPKVINGKPLTSRQEEILIAICSGRPYRQVGQMLGITEGSLKVYMSHLMGVTGKNRTELALIGYHISMRRREAALLGLPAPVPEPGPV
jgi:DNA-binding NarL/FixJ family response regulator